MPLIAKLHFKEHEALYEMVGVYEVDKLHVGEHIKEMIIKLDVFAKSYKKLYVELKEEFLTLALDSKKLKKKDESLLFHYLNDEKKIANAIKEDGEIPEITCELESVFFYISDYMGNRALDELGYRLMDLTLEKTIYKNRLAKIKEAFFAMAFQVARSHLYGVTFIEDADIPLAKKETYIHSLTHEALFFLLDDNKLSFEGMRKIALRSKEFSFHLWVKLYHAIESRAHKDSDFYHLHSYIEDKTFGYSPKEVKRILNTSVSLLDTNPHGWQKHERVEIAKSCESLILRSKKTPKESVALRMMDEIKAINVKKYTNQT
jgi:hypothetical protein